MGEESDIVKKLRNAERLGLLKSKVLSVYEDVETVDDSVEDNSVRTIAFNNEDESKDSLENFEFVGNYEMLYKSIFENYPDSIIVLDMKGIIKSCNPATYKMLGYSKEEIIGKSFHKFGKNKKNDIPKFLKMLASVSQGKVTEPYEVNIYHKDGTTILAEICVCLLRNNGEKIGIQAIIRDITEQNKPKDELDTYHQNQDLLIEEGTTKLQQEIEKNKKVNEELMLKNIVFESSVAANSTADVNGIINYVNQSFLILWGYDTKDEVIGKPISFFFKNEEDVTPVIESLNRTGKWDGEFIGKRKDESTFVTKALAIAVKNDIGEMIGYYSTNLDFSEQKKIEEELIKNRFESEEKYKALVKASAEGILIVDVETKKLQFANPRLLKMFGYDENEITNLCMSDIHPEESLEFVFSEFEAQLKGIKSLAENIPCLRKDGTIFYADVNAAAFILNGRKSNVGFFRDISDRKKAGEKLKEKIKELERWKKVTVGRELHMQKLKETIKKLENEEKNR